MRKKRTLTLRGRENLTAHLFLIPFYLGLIFFFLTPLIESIKMSFADVSVTMDNYHYNYVGFNNFKIAFFKDADFMLNIGNTVMEMLWKVPLVNVFAIFLAILINQKFKGRIVVRAIFFLPLIFASGVAYDILQGDYISKAAMSGADISTSGITYTNGLETFLTNSGVGSELIDIVSKIAGSIFGVAWVSGVQMILYLAALQSISPTLYEAANVEGASTWDSFWKITLPNLLPIMLVCMVYTVVDTFTSTSNVVMKQITGISSTDITRMGISSAFSWVYFIVILAILAVILLLFRLLSSERGKGAK